YGNCVDRRASECARGKLHLPARHHRPGRRGNGRWDPHRLKRRGEHTRRDRIPASQSGRPAQAAADDGQSEPCHPLARRGTGSHPGERSESNLALLLVAARAPRSPRSLCIRPPTAPPVVNRGVIGGLSALLPPHSTTRTSTGGPPP